MASIVVANLTTTEKYFDHFQIELHLDNSGLNRLDAKPAKATLNPTTGVRTQSELVAFSNCTAGQKYYFRSAVVDQAGNYSPWSAWSSETAANIPSALAIPTNLNFLKWRGDFGTHPDTNDLSDFLVQSMIRREDSTTGGQVTMHQTFPHANVQGNTILAFIWTENQDVSSGISVSDTQGNTYSQVALNYAPSKGQAIAVFKAVNIAGGPGNQVTSVIHPGSSGQGEQTTLVIELDGSASIADSTASDVESNGGNPLISLTSNRNSDLALIFAATRLTDTFTPSVNFSAIAPTQVASGANNPTGLFGFAGYASLPFGSQNVGFTTGSGGTDAYAVIGIALEIPNVGFYQLYDVVKFQEETWVCLSKTSLSPSQSPSSWTLLAPHVTGGVLVKTADYAAQEGDYGPEVVFNSSSALTYTLLNPPANSKWATAVQNVGSAAITIARNGTSIDGVAANLTLKPGQGLNIFWDSITSAYYTVRGLGPVYGGVLVKTADYTVASTDDGLLIVLNSSASHTLTLPATPPSAKWKIKIQNIGTAAWTLARNGNQIDDAGADVTVQPNSGMDVFTDFTNYFTSRGGSNIGVLKTTTFQTTGTLNPNQTESGAWSIAKSFAVVKLVLAAPARVRLYSTAAFRDADLSRFATQAPVAGTQHGVILDIVLNATTGLTWILSPTARGSDCAGSPTGSIAYNVTNLGAGNQQVQATLTYVVNE